MIYRVETLHLLEYKILWELTFFLLTYGFQDMKCLLAGYVHTFKLALHISRNV